MVEHGDGHKGIWISEYGWPMKDEHAKSKRLIQALEEFNDPKYYYVTMANYLSLSDPAGEPDYGLCERDLKPRPSYHAFKRIHAWPRVAKPGGQGESGETEVGERGRRSDRENAVRRVALPTNLQQGEHTKKVAQPALRCRV